MSCKWTQSNFFCIFTKSVASIPNSGWKTIFLHEISAARTAPWIVPDFHGMVWLHRTCRMEFLPDPIPPGGTVPQNYRRNFRPEKAGEFNFLLHARAPTQFGEDIYQFAAVPAHHRLHFAVNAAVRPATNFRAVVTIRTLEMKRPAHAKKIPLPPTKTQAAIARPATKPVVHAA